MDSGHRSLSQTAKQRYEAEGPNCALLPMVIGCLGDFTAAVSAFQSADAPFWFRGHGDFRWGLSPSALRLRKRSGRDRALELAYEFKRRAASGLEYLPADDNLLEWCQIAQHYGIPTRMLDWTETASVALYFACQHAATDGAVFILEPRDLNKQLSPSEFRILDYDHDKTRIDSYMALDGERVEGRSGKPTIAILPSWHSPRIERQRGTFTIHGSKNFTLTSDQAPSLMYVPVPRQAKRALLRELERTAGVDEMSNFPEPEHIAAQIVRRARLTSL